MLEQEGPDILDVITVEIGWPKTHSVLKPQTVTIGLTGEPTAPGRYKGGAVSRKRLRFAPRSQVANGVRCQSSPKWIPTLNKHFSWIGSNRWHPSPCYSDRPPAAA